MLRSPLLGSAASLLLAAAAPLAAGPGSSGGAHHSHAERPAAALQTGGGARAELTADERHGTLSLHFTGANGSAHAIQLQALKLRVEPAGAFPWPFDVELAPLRRPDDPAGLASRFVGSHPELVGLDRFRATLRGGAGGVGATTFEVDVRAAAPAFVCPMHCEGPKTYEASGRCPACGMALRSVREAHGDHSPKHGGILFMAPDGWHHLEGVLSSMREFRLYLYNDFTRPIPASPFARRSWVEVTTPTGESARLPLVDAREGQYLRAALPADLLLPLDVELHLLFDGRSEPERFDFRFEALSN